MPVRAMARVNLAAIERNCRRLRRELGSSAPSGPSPDAGADSAPGAIAGAATPTLCAVVKADGYGHGAAPAARAALAGGATSLAVAAAEEAAALRAAGIDAPVLVMGALTPEEVEIAIAAGAGIVASREALVAMLGRLAGHRAGGASGNPSGPAVGVHVKLDTGMGRLGTRDADEALRVADAVAAAPGLTLAGAMTHFATADERENSFFAEQMDRFIPWVARVRERHDGVIVHAANSAATLRTAAAHFDMVRCGVGIYGLDPFGEDPVLRDLEPALELRSWVADVKPVAPGESAGYGRRFVAERATNLAVLPIGYGDGWRRALTNNADVLIRGRRYPLVGTVSMDNITVDVGPDPDVQPGDEATLIGASGGERITTEEVARRLGTINYEVTCALLPRVPRVYHRDGEPAQPGDQAALRASTSAREPKEPAGR
ncbi:MAG TPA: alanine racemase [Solirubrobacteraceae bacterium]|jgi:alanine racemase|nr:alanine racemase [Solirubrobacteraceae bacterium]